MREMINDDASDWFRSQGQEIQDYEAPETPDFDEVEGSDLLDEAEERPFGDVPEVTNDDVRNVTNLRAISRPTAEVIVGTLDVVVPLLITFIVRGSDSEDAKLTDSEHETLVEAWSTYLGDKNVQVSPGVALIIAMVTIYGSKVITAVEHRKEREELKRKEAEIARLTAALDAEREHAKALEAAQATPPPTDNNTENNKKNIKA